MMQLFHWRCELLGHTGAWVNLPPGKPAPNIVWRTMQWLFFGTRWFKVYVADDGMSYAEKRVQDEQQAEINRGTTEGVRRGDERSGGSGDELPGAV